MPSSVNMTPPAPPSPPSSIRQASERQALVRWVRDTPGLQEPDWLEWKLAYDLTKKPGRATTAKHLLGLANRDPDSAARHLDGHGCVLLGVEPGACPGMPEHDSADLESWLRPFVGEEVVFDVHYVTLDGARVLLLDVEPPRLGDAIHALRRSSEDADTGNNLREGTVFVRKTGKTEPANAADIDRLTERARQVGMSLTIGLQVAGPVKALDPYLLREEVRDGYLKELRAEFLAGLPQPPSGLTSIARSDASEPRSAEQFVAEIDRFVADAKDRWETFATVKELKSSPSKLELELVNGSDDNFERVTLEVDLPLPRARVHLSASEAEDWLEPPEEPPRWGSGRFGRIKFPTIASPEAELVEQGDTSTLIRFAPIAVRPRTRHAMPEVLRTLPPDLAGQTLEATWRATPRARGATSRGRSGSRSHPRPGQRCSMSPTGEPRRGDASPVRLRCSPERVEGASRRSRVLST